VGTIAGFLLPDLPLRFDRAAGAAEIACTRPHIIDGDTMDCAGTRIRLASIDAPEMPHHCRSGRQCTPGDPYAARDYLSFLTRGRVACRPVDIDVYGRTVASCNAEGRDLSCAMVEAGRAVRRYGWLWCRV
jgi:endonuclease YncB( thermonuclease family)